MGVRGRDGLRDPQPHGSAVLKARLLARGNETGCSRVWLFLRRGCRGSAGLKNEQETTDHADGTVHGNLVLFARNAYAETALNGKSRGILCQGAVNAEAMLSRPVLSQQNVRMRRAPCGVKTTWSSTILGRASKPI
jgi:hypothetical protein